MAANSGWWTLSLDGNNHNDLTECDLEHIAQCIKDGFTSGEIVQDDEE